MVKSILISLFTGVLGFALTWGGWHLWLDHQVLHQLVQVEIQRQQQAHPAPPSTQKPEAR